MISEHKIFNKRINIALLFFVISAVYGLLLRWQFVQPVFKYPYSDVLQAHSHVTFLGWGFLCVITLITASFVSKKEQKKSVFTISFWLMIACIVGMLVSFPLQGYSYFSISFLTLFLLSSYVYLWMLYRILRKDESFSSRFIKMGIIYYYLSSMGIWALSYITVKIGRGDLYQNAINFYTHFLYNGFFVMVLFGLFVHYMQSIKIALPKQTLKWFYWLTNFAVLPGFATALLWKTVPSYVIIIGFIAVFVQLVSLYYLWRLVLIIYIQKAIVKKTMSSLLLKIVLGAYTLKVIFQFFGAFPEITQFAMQYKSYFVIGYIHLFTLGFLSLFLFLLIRLVLHEKLLKWGILLFILGIIFTELLLFLQGILLYTNEKTINNFYEILLMASAFMPLGLIVILLSRLLKKPI